MVEYVVDVRAYLGGYSVAEVEVLVNPEIHTPGARPPEHVPLGNSCLAEKVCSYRGDSERSRIPNSVTTPLIEVIAKHHWAEGLVIEITHCIYRTYADVARGYGGIIVRAIVTCPERSEPRTGFCEHVKGGLPPTKERISKPGHRGTILATSTERQIVDAIGNYAIAGNIAVDSIIAVWLELIIGHTAEAGIAGVQRGRFLVQIRIRNAEHQAVGIAMLELRLESVQLCMAIVSEASYEIPERWEPVTLAILIRNIAICAIDRLTYPRRFPVITHGMSAKWNVTWLKLVQVSTGDQTVHCGS